MRSKQSHVPILYKSCINTDNIPHLSKWSKLGSLDVRPNTVKYQLNEHIRSFLYFDKSRPWSKRYSQLQYNTLNEKVNFDQFLNQFTKKMLDDSSSVYGTWRLPSMIRHTFEQSLQPIIDRLPTEISNELKSFDNQQSWNLWMASQRSRASPHYDIDHNIIIQLHGKKRYVLCSLSSYVSSSSLALYPSTHPHWRHLIPNMNSSDIIPTQDVPSTNKEEGVSIFGEDSKKLLEDTNPIIVDLDPGDVLYIPPYYFHATESSFNHNPTSSVNIWFGTSSQQTIEDNLRKMPLPVNKRKSPSSVFLNLIHSLTQEADPHDMEKYDQCENQNNVMIPRGHVLAELKRRCFTQPSCSSLSSSVQMKGEFDQLQPPPQFKDVLSSFHQIIASECDVAVRTIIVADFIDELLEITSSLLQKNETKKMNSGSIGHGSDAWTARCELVCQLSIVKDS